MKKIKTQIAAVLIACVTLAAGAAWAGGVVRYSYELHIVNKTGQSVKVKKVELRIKRNNWKSWKSLYSGTKTLSKNKEFTKETKYSKKHHYQFRAVINCGGADQTITSKRTWFDSSDNDSNKFFTLKKIKGGKCEVKKTDDT